MARVFTPRDARPERLGSVTKDVLEVISAQWPVNPLEVARALGENGKGKTMSSKYLYHFRKLRQMELIEMKRTAKGSTEI